MGTLDVLTSRRIKIVAEERRRGMKWTKEAPNSVNWWWYREDGILPHPVLVVYWENPNGYLAAHMRDENRYWPLPSSELGGEWSSEPIPWPSED